tara:strand:+ start:209 stop:826 length:618 start_codon:yes stop_codon:yes gene_type:complete
MNFKIVENKGYKISEVDRFLNEKNKPDSAKKTVEEIENIRFSLTRRKGYDPKEVDVYLDGLIETKKNLSPRIDTAPISKLPEKNSLQGMADEVKDKAPPITSERLRELTPPIVEGIGYLKSEVDYFLQLVADTLQTFEEKSGNELENLKADQYLPQNQSQRLLTSDQIRWALFTVNEEGGYDMRGVDAAVNRLADALDHHWLRKE